MGSTTNRKSAAGFAVCLLLIFVAACATMNTAPGSYAVQEKTLGLASGEALRYTLALPPALSSDRPRPLVVALHYGGRVTPYYGKPFLMNLVLPALSWGLMYDLPARTVLIVSPDTGEKTFELALPAAPAYQGMAVIDGRAILALEDGSLVCVGKAK